MPARARSSKPSRTSGAPTRRRRSSEERGDRAPWRRRVPRTHTMRHPTMPDRAAIVTGASRGIGRALAEVLGEEGYGLTISARKPDSLEESATALRDKGFDVEHVAGNMADEEAIRAIVERHRERFGRLDVLVNNAGVKSVAFCPGFVDTDMADFVKQAIPAEDMLRTSDIAEALRFLLRLSPTCVVPEIIFQRPGETI